MTPRKKSQFTSLSLSLFCMGRERGREVCCFSISLRNVHFLRGGGGGLLRPWRIYAKSRCVGGKEFSPFALGPGRGEGEKGETRDWVFMLGRNFFFFFVSPAAAEKEEEEKVEKVRRNKDESAFRLRALSKRAKIVENRTKLWNETKVQRRAGDKDTKATTPIPRSPTSVVARAASDGGGEKRD